MKFWCGSGSGSADPCLWLMYPDPDSGFRSCYLHHWPSRCQQKTNLKKFRLSHIYIIFLKINSQRESQNSRNQGFSYYFCMMIEGSGSIPLTNASRSGRPKNMWIRIRKRIRIRNTDQIHPQSIFANQLISGTNSSFPQRAWAKQQCV